MNILISGTPGSGKSFFCKELSNRLGSCKTLNVSEIVKSEQEMQLNYDSIYDSIIMHESAVRKHILSLIKKSPNNFTLIECHSPGIFKYKDPIDLVVVLSVETSTLFDRLTLRGYSHEKREMNLTAEIMQECWQEAVDIFGKGDKNSKRVFLFPNNNQDELHKSLDCVISCLQKTIKNIQC